MKIVNIIVTYNRVKSLQIVFENLIAKGWKNIVLIDNCSTDDVRKLVDAYKNKIKIIYSRLNKNYGSSGGFHHGLKLFFQHFKKTDYALLHDDDSWASFNYDLLLNEIGILKKNIFCLPVVDTENHINKMNIPGRAGFLNNPFLFFKNRKINQIKEDEVYRKVDYASFVGLGINYKIIQKYGLPSKEFFIYSDDTYYTLSINKYEDLFFIDKKELSFIHDCKRSTGKTLIDGKFINYEIINKIVLLRTFSKFHLLFCLFFLIKSLINSPIRATKIISFFIQGYNRNIQSYKNIKIENVQK